MEEKETKVTIEHGEIDEDVLKIINRTTLFNDIKDDATMKRIMVNAFCELISQMKEFSKTISEISSNLTILSEEKLVQLFTAYGNKAKKANKAGKKSTKTVVK